MKYYQAGYYLIKINKVDHDSIKDRKILTASDCINDSYFDSWSFSWANDGKEKSKIANEVGLSEEKIIQLQNWVDKKIELNKIGWKNIFYSLEAVYEYKDEYFNDRTDLVVLGLSFSEREIEDLIEEFKPQGENIGEIGIRYALRQRIPENQKGTFIGYDIVGIKIDGRFHTIHCHSLQNELTKKFGIEFFENGLIKFCEDWKMITEYCNDESNGLEPVPWYYCKVKIYE
jgi:hypothetical protein